MRHWHVVAKKVNHQLRDSLRKKYQQWVFGDVYSDSYWRVQAYKLINKKQIIARLIDQQTYSSDAVSSMMQDYYQRKKAMEKIKE